MASPEEALDIGALEGDCRDLWESSSHESIATITVALCALPDPPPWAVDDVAAIEALSAHGAALVRELRSDVANLAARLDSLMREAEPSDDPLDAAWSTRTRDESRRLAAALRILAARVRALPADAGDPDALA